MFTISHCKQYHKHVLTVIRINLENPIRDKHQKYVVVFAIKKYVNELGTKTYVPSNFPYRE